MNRHASNSNPDVTGIWSAHINRLFAEWDRIDSPGAVLAVSRGGEIVHRRGYGVANVEDQVPFRSNTVMRLGSTTKHLCATCILILENRGQLSLEDDIRNWVPELPDFGVSINLRHLLTMTSGLPDGINLLLFAGLDSGYPLSREQALRLYCAQPRLMFAPGDSWVYSNTNYSLLSLVIERISGLSLADFMQREIFEPLGMQHTRLTPWMHDAVPFKARGYEPGPEGSFRAGYMMMELDGNGGVDSTLDDMQKWLDNYRNDRVFGPDFRLRLEAETRLNDGRLLEYRLGIEVKSYRGLRVVRHAGGMPGYLCDFVFFPEPDLGMVMFTNLLEPRMLELPDRIADVVLEQEFPKPRSSMRVDSVEKESRHLPGLYADVEHGLVVEISERDGAMVCYWLGDLHLLQGRDGWLCSRKAPLAFRAAGDGLEMQQGCGRSHRLKRVPNPGNGQEEPEGSLQEYTGSFHHDQLGEVHEIRMSDEGLTITLPSPIRVLVWDRLLRIQGDLFVARVKGEPSCTNVVVRFLRNGLGQVDALSYSINRCENVVFQRLA